MRIPPEVWQGKIRSEELTDVDVAYVLGCWDTPDKAKVLEVGSHDESALVARLLSSYGCQVIGVDLRDPNCEEANKSYQYIQVDFCDLPASFIREHAGTFDAAYSISAIEHFGLGTYEEGSENLLYDVIACRQVWQLLKEGGVFYLTVPFGRSYLEIAPYWRCYNKDALFKRLIGDFTLEEHAFFMSANAEDKGKIVPKGTRYTIEQAMQFPGHPPEQTALVILRKNSKNRIAPKGR